MLLDLVILGVPEVGLGATAHNRQQREPEVTHDIKHSTLDKGAQHIA